MNLPTLVRQWKNHPRPLNRTSCPHTFHPCSPFSSKRSSPSFPHLAAYFRSSSTFPSERQKAARHPTWPTVVTLSSLENASGADNGDAPRASPVTAKAPKLWFREQRALKAVAGVSRTNMTAMATERMTDTKLELIGNIQQEQKWRQD